MKRFAIVTLLVAFSAAATVWASGSLSGRDIVDAGSKVTLSGILAEEDGEWSLKTEDKTYAVHLGNYGVLYPEGLGLKAGEQASVSGFLAGDELSAISLASHGAAFTFRKDDGTPLWAGKGNNRNKN